MESTEQSRFDLAFAFITAALGDEDDGSPEIFADLLIGLTGEQAEETIIVLATGFVCLLDEMAQMHGVPVAAVWQAFAAQAQQALMEGLG